MPHVDAIAPSYQNVHKHFITRSLPLFPPWSLIMDRWHTETCCVFSWSGLDFIPLPSTTYVIALPASTIFSISVRCTARLLFSMIFLVCGTLVCSLCHFPVMDYRFVTLGPLQISFIIADPSFSSRVPAKNPIIHVP